MKKLRKTIYLKFARLLGRGRNGVSVPTIIAENTIVKGNMNSTGILHVDGTIDGDVTCEELIIGVKGSIHFDSKIARNSAISAIKLG